MNQYGFRLIQVKKDGQRANPDRNKYFRIHRKRSYLQKQLGVAIVYVNPDKRLVTVTDHDYHSAAKDTLSTPGIGKGPNSTSLALQSCMTVSLEDFKQINLCAVRGEVHYESGHCPDHDYRENRRASAGKNTKKGAE